MLFLVLKHIYNALLLLGFKLGENALTFNPRPNHDLDITKIVNNIHFWVKSFNVKMQAMVITIMYSHFIRCSCSPEIEKNWCYVNK